jgi:predicted ArsR family transcriptional regulator
MERRADPSRRDEAVEHRALADPSRLRILDVLRDRGALDAREIAPLVGLHHNTVRSHLDVLERGGLVSRELERRDRPGRPRLLYRVVERHGGDGDAGRYQLLSTILAGYLSAAGDGAAPAMDAAGRGWGHVAVGDVEGPVDEREARERLIALLDEVGFEPESRGDRTVLLHACPFRDVARAHPEVVCSVHLGLMRGALERLGAGIEATGLDPFVEPDLCIAHLAPAEDDR